MDPKALFLSTFRRSITSFRNYYFQKTNSNSYCRCNVTVMCTSAALCCCRPRVLSPRAKLKAISVTSQMGLASDTLTDTGTNLQSVMRTVPQPVVIVTSAEHNASNDTWYKRGLTCSSFTSVSLNPPIVSFCVNRPSRMHDLLIRVKQFAIHVLASEQVKHGVHFAQPAIDDKDQFTNIQYTQTEQGIPILADCCAVLQCEEYSVQAVGDHYVWYGRVKEITTNKSSCTRPLLFFIRSFRSIGDEIFLKAFEDATLPFEDWSHEAHIRMAWNYIREHGCDEAIPLIRKGILKYNEQNRERVRTGYHETVTIYFSNMIAAAIRAMPDKDHTFEEFIVANNRLSDKAMILKYYSKDRLSQESAQHVFIPPDKQPFPE